MNPSGGYGLVARQQPRYCEFVKTLSVQEASQNLASWLRRAAGGERITIREGDAVVLLQPLSAPPAAGNLSPLAALRQLQSQRRLTAREAEEYLREVNAERLTDGGRNGQ